MGNQETKPARLGGQTFLPIFNFAPARPGRAARGPDKPPMGIWRFGVSAPVSIRPSRSAGGELIFDRIGTGWEQDGEGILNPKSSAISR